MTEAGQKLHGLDHLRAFAILFVILFHYQLPLFGHPEWLERVAKFGWTGVDLFFVLSGFLISSQLFSTLKKGNTISLKHFFLKRCFRILPAYVAVLLIYFCIPFFREREALPSLWKFLTFTQNLGLDIGKQGTFSHAWSLCVEEHFYFLLPIVLIMLVNKKLFGKAYLLLLVFFVFGFIIRHISWQNFYFPSIQAENAVIYWYRYVYYTTYNRIDGLLVGIGIAAAYNFKPLLFEKLSGFANLILMLGISMLICIRFLFEDEHSYEASVLEFPLVALSYGLIVMAAVSKDCILYKFKSRITTFIAALSYGIYLTHKGIMHITQELLSRWHIDINSNFALISCLLTTIGAAGILYISIEKPFMTWRRKITG